LLHPIPNGDSGLSCFVSMSSHQHGSRTFHSASFHPWKFCHVTTGSHDSTYVAPWPLWQGLVVIVIVPTYVTLPQREGDWHRLLRHLQLCCYTTNAVDWVVQRPNHRAILSLTTAGPDLPVPAPRHGSLPAVPRLVPSGTAPCTVSRSKGPVYRLRGCWPFVYVMPQDVAVYRHAGRSSLTSWGTFRAAQVVLGRDVLITAVLASFACESHELIRDVLHHGQTSAGRAHRCSMLS
jgi:hypothetical protein